MTVKDFSVIQLVVDRSGSMSGIWEDAEGAINTFIKQQQKEDGRCLIRITTFDHEFETSTDMVDIKDVEKFELKPRGMTALYDAMGMSIQEMGDKLAKMPEDERPENVIFVTITDGFDNRSHDFTPETLKPIIERQQNEYSWTFLFLAANQDAVLTGRNLGVRADRSMSYSATGGGYQAMAASTSFVTSGIRSGMKTNTSFTDEDRKKAGGSS